MTFPLAILVLLATGPVWWWITAELLDWWHSRTDMLDTVDRGAHVRAQHALRPNRTTASPGRTR